MTPRRLLGALWLLSALAVIIPAATARADSESDARELFTRARALRTAGDCPSALPLFRKAYEVYPAGLGSARNIAECEETLGHHAAARRAWSDLRAALRTNTDAKYAGWDHDAEQATTKLAAEVASLTVDVAGGKPLSPAGNSPTIAINGQTLAPGAWGMALELDPGHYVIRLEDARGGEPQERVVDLSAGDRRQVVFAPELAPARSPPLATAEVPTRPRAGGNGPLRVGGWVAVSVGAASLIGAGVSGIVYEAALSTVNTECGSDRAHCPQARAASDRGHAAATAFNVLFPIGAVGAATGGVLLVLGYAGRTPTVGVAAGPGGVLLHGVF